MFSPRYIKQSKLLLRHGQKFLRYKSDVLPPAERETLVTNIDALRAALKARDHKRIQEDAERLDGQLARLTPVTWESHWRENCEVVLVAIVVAIGIRSYFLQPFKIPTGSMQPTLNGIIGHPMIKPSPNIFEQAFEFVAFGRNYINVVAKQEDEVVRVVSQKFAFFFTFSRIVCRNQSYLVYASPDTLRNDFRVGPGSVFRAGEIIARGAIDTGDQVFVDKFTYNFRKPHRGAVFVFRTDHIYGIREDPTAGAPFFIKRLAGLPGDHLHINPPFLLVDGKKAQGIGFERVMSAKAPYQGYSHGPDNYGHPLDDFVVPPDGYFAMGDNSYSSYDSRFWGPVPEKNLVGRGLLVYWPFTKHWGLIR